MIKSHLFSKFTGHSGSIYTLEKSSDSSKFFSAGSDTIVACWNLENPKEDGELIAKATDVIYSLRYISSSQKLLIGQGKGELHVINLETKQEERLLQLHESPLFEIALSPNHELVFVLAGDGSFSVLNSNDFSLLAKVKISESKLRCIAFHPDGKSAYIGCGEGYVQVISLPDLKILDRYQLHEEGFSVNTLLFSADADFLLSGSRDAHLNITDSKTMKVVESIPAHNYAIYDIVFSPDKNLFATASRDKTIKIWNAHSYEMLHRIENGKTEAHKHSVNKLLWMDYDNLLLSTGDDRSIIAWDLQAAN